MGFQIKTKDGIALTMSELDKEACEFWDKEVHNKNYATPNIDEGHVGNWFDIIGYSIHNPANYTSGWNNIALTLINIFIVDLMINCRNKEKVEVTSVEDATKRLVTVHTFTAPYIALINHWMSKGYTPHKVD